MTGERVSAEYVRAGRRARRIVALVVLAVLSAGLGWPLHTEVSLREKALIRRVSVVTLEVVTPPVKATANASRTPLLEESSRERVAVQDKPVQVEKPVEVPAAEPEKPAEKQQKVPQKTVKKPVRKAEPERNRTVKTAPVPLKTERAQAVAREGTSAEDSTPASPAGEPSEGVTQPVSGGGEKVNEADELSRLVAVVEAHKAYPRRARQNNEEGRLSIRLMLDEQGVVRSIKLGELHPSRLLQKAALSAAEPLVGVKTRLGGPREVEIPIVFSLS